MNLKHRLTTGTKHDFYYLKFKSLQGEEMKYTETMWFEMKPNIYGGENLDEHIPMWNGYADGDKQDDTTTDSLIFDPKDFPPGTKIVISEPVCPKCNEVYQNCIVRSQNNGCDFDWKNWTEEQYS